MNWLQCAALGLTAWLAFAVACALPLGAFISLRRNVRATPCPGERDQQSASNVDAELDGSRLPAGMVGQNHTRSNLTTREQDIA